IDDSFVASEYGEHCVETPTLRAALAGPGGGPMSDLPQMWEDPCPSDCPEHPRRIDISDTGHVWVNGVLVGTVIAEHWGKRTVWKACDVDGNIVPERGNQVRATAEKAAE